MYRMNPLLEIKGLSVSYRTPAGEAQAVTAVSLVLGEGEILAIIGETGCGKTSLARAVLRLLGENARISGEVRFGSRDLLAATEKELSSIRGNAISIILQNPEPALNPVLTVGRQLMEVLQIHRRIKREAARRRVEEILVKMLFPDIPSLLEKYPFQLSGGMAQRVLIAAAMLNEPTIIIADEPTRALDKELRSSVAAALLAGDQTDRPAVLLITHDLDLAARFSNRTAVMYAGETVEICDTKKFFEKPLHPYSQALLGSLPGKGFQALAGMMPAALDLPRGCRFHPRCKYRTDVCTRRKPGFISIANRQVRCTKYA